MNTNSYNPSDWNNTVSTVETKEPLTSCLEELFVFVKVTDLKSFSAAALALGSTKSTVSKQVRRLEEVLGTRLLNRSTRSLGLTESGATVYRHGCRIIEETAALVDAVDGLQDRPHGHLRVTTSSAFGNLHLTRLLGGFLAQYPEIRLSLVLNDRYVNVVEEGFDVAVRLTSRPIDSFVARRLAGIDYAVCATPAYLAAHAAIRLPADLAGHDCILNPLAPGPDWTFTRDGASTVVPVRGRLTVNSSESVRVAVLGGGGVGLLPLYAVAADVQAGRLQVLLPDYAVDGGFGNSVYAIFAPGKFLAPKIRVFIDYLVAAFDGSAPWSAT
jgi:DNA-binding transcriptional LysR family regulator